MNTILATVVLFVLGLAIGSGVTTTLWSGMLTRAQTQTEDAYVQFEQAMSLAKQNLETAQSCAENLNRLVRR